MLPPPPPYTILPEKNKPPSIDYGNFRPLTSFGSWGWFTVAHSLDDTTARNRNNFFSYKILSHQSEIYPMPSHFLYLFEPTINYSDPTELHTHAQITEVKMLRCRMV